MKESIEKKFGMSIEKYSKRLKKLHKKYKRKGMCVEMINPLAGLTKEEKEFLIAYVMENGLEIYV